MRDLIYDRLGDLKKSRVVAATIFTLLYLGIYSLLGIVGDSDPSSILNTDPYFLLVMQAFAAGLFFVLLPWLMVRFFWNVEKGIFPTISGKSVGLILLIVFANMIVLSGIVEWNIGIDLPDGAFEEWASAKEAELKVLTEHLIEFEGVGHFFLALFAVAVIPAIGEELLFRGVLQNTLRKLSGNKHLAIWISAILFSAIHLQFYGFFPRMLLGALFGYLYLWSGKLSVAVLAHFFHNGLALLFAYIAGLSGLEMEPEQLEKSAPIWLIGVFALIAGYAIFMFYKSHHDKVEERI